MFLTEDWLSVNIRQIFLLNTLYVTPRIKYLQLDTNIYCLLTAHKQQWTHSVTEVILQTGGNMLHSSAGLVSEYNINICIQEYTHPSKSIRQSTAKIKSDSVWINKWFKTNKWRAYQPAWS